MRVIAGELGGRRLLAPPGAAIRPTSDRAREALFSILGPMDGRTVLDLFCGTGALAIEALSRGASEATLVDIDTTPAAANVEALGIGVRARLVDADAIAFLAREERRFDLICCDAPYTLAAALGSDLEKLVPDRLAPGGLLAVESAAFAPLELVLPSELEPTHERRYGGALVRVWRRVR